MVNLQEKNLKSSKLNKQALFTTDSNLNPTLQETPKENTTPYKLSNSQHPQE